VSVEAGSLDRVVAAILGSRKYTAVAPEVVRRIVSESLGEAGSEREAAKRARRKLHQAYGAFGSVDHRRIDALVCGLEALPRTDPAALTGAAREAGREILGFHVSTAERLLVLEELYGFALGPSLPEGCRILDLGCGLAPFALPWMRLPPGSEYRAVDLDGTLAALIDRYLAAMGQRGGAAAADVLSSGLRTGPWDVVLLLKLLPTLERQERGAAERLVSSLDARRIVISFPRASLTGKRKGMDASYARLLERLAAAAGLTVEGRVLPSESVYLCRRVKESVAV
jgi:16S rRNA (guanine(1405)-N(7))-methyltransferase